MLCSTSSSTSRSKTISWRLLSRGCNDGVTTKHHSSFILKSLRYDSFHCRRHPKPHQTFVTVLCYGREDETAPYRAVLLLTMRTSTLNTIGQYGVRHCPDFLSLVLPPPSCWFFFFIPTIGEVTPFRSSKANPGFASSPASPTSPCSLRFNMSNYPFTSSEMKAMAGVSRLIEK